MDASNATATEGVMLAFLPTTSEWCNIDLPHMTLVYAGTTVSRSSSDFNALTKDAAFLSMMTNPFALRVRDVDVFGDEDKVNVLRLEATPELKAMRKYVEHWNQSKHSFNPHATIGPADQYAEVRPGALYFNRLMVAWGDESIIFKL